MDYFGSLTAWENFTLYVWFIQLLVAVGGLLWFVISLMINGVLKITDNTLGKPTKKIWVHALFISFYIAYPIAAIIIYSNLEKQNNDEFRCWLFFLGLLLYSYIIYRHIFRFNNNNQKSENMNLT
jgi:hypothetical protein